MTNLDIHDTGILVGTAKAGSGNFMETIFRVRGLSDATLQDDAWAPPPHPLRKAVAIY